MSWFQTAIGFVAAFCTTICYVPQVKKPWQSGSVGDLSFKMLALLTIGVSLWLVYGFFKEDAVIVFANGATLLLTGILFFLKIRERQRGGEQASD